jgi:ADP-heptose:LPS heptosyltransferase
MKTLKHIIISRTDGIGDVVLTLPLCGVLKKHFPDTRISFLGANYTKPVIECCVHIDAFISYDTFKTDTDKTIFLKALNADAIVHVFPRKTIAQAAKDAGIPIRIGTSHRVYNWLTCNKRVSVGRKNSDLHEAQLNLKLLKPLGISADYQPQQLAAFYGFESIQPLPNHFEALLDKNKFNLILHPKSNGSAREWGLGNFEKLIALLPPENFKVFISGSKTEKDLLQDLIKKLPANAVDVSGQMSLTEFIAFIHACDGLVAASTGPLHIAAAAGIHALGLFAPIRPVHPGRWAPVGKQAEFVMLKDNCNSCKNKPQSCACIQDISPHNISNHVQGWRKTWQA